MALNRSDKSRILRRYFPGMTRNSEMSTEPSLVSCEYGHQKGSSSLKAHLLSLVILRIFTPPSSSYRGTIAAEQRNCSGRHGFVVNYITVPNPHTCTRNLAGKWRQPGQRLYLESTSIARA